MSRDDGDCMSSKKVYKVSVKDLVSYVLRSGDLVFDIGGTNRTLEGLFAHIKHQKNMGDEYQSEIHVTKTISFPSFDLKVTGRIDGLYEDKGLLIIDEIKSTYANLDDIDVDFNPLHWAQVLCYGFIYAEDEKLDELYLQLTYIQLEDDELKRLKKHYTFPQLKKEFMDMVQTYGTWVEKLERLNNAMILSTHELEFPFSGYRKGQRELAVAVYKTIKEGKGQRLFARAPTGTGKTLATLFPAIKALGQGHGEKIFYLTAKTIGREVANSTLDLLEANGLSLKRITLTAKDKMCLLEERDCAECPYTEGYFDKVNQVVEEVLENKDRIDREVILDYAKNNGMCPYELSLDLSLFCHAIICDYNYAFDPRVSLKRYFAEASSELILLVDEAHNLVDRGRSMYSSELTKKPFLEMKRNFNDDNKHLKKKLNEANSAFIQFRKICETCDGAYKQTEKSDAFIKILRKLHKHMEAYLTENKVFSFKDSFLDLFFDINHFIKISELYDEQYVTYYEKIGTDVKIKLFCLDPSNQLKRIQDGVKATIVFSATLLPMNYYMDLLGGDKESYNMQIPSPFTQDHLGLLFHAGISTKYKHRQSSYMDVAMSIHDTIDGDKGNYFAFFPSYSYLDEVRHIFQELYPSIYVIAQEQGMSEQEKEDFLNEFEAGKDETMVAFAVMGSSFSEGIDLIGDRLKGVVIVGVGLPMVCFERNIIKEYFDQNYNSGFSYAYIYPGMNKVLQAVGRVIRREEDIGVAVLIDERFSYGQYQNLFPAEWSHGKFVYHEEQVRDQLTYFWEGIKEEGDYV